MALNFDLYDLEKY